MNTVSYAGQRLLSVALVIVVVAALSAAIAGCGSSFNSITEQSTSENRGAPIVSCVASPANVAPGGMSQISARAVSPLGLPLVYSYGATGGSIANQGNTAMLDTQGVSGNIVVTCKAEDTKGNIGSSSASVDVQVAVSAPPTVSCSASPADVTAGGVAMITAVANSPEHLPLSYSWGTSAGTISGNEGSATLDTTGVKAGTITISCKVSDTQGHTASAATSVAVSEPVTAPPIVSCAADPKTVTLGNTATITAVASSPEGRPLSYSWSASSGAIVGVGSTVNLNTAGSVAGTTTITCKVADDQGRSASATTSVLVSAPAAAPPVVSCSANPANVVLGSTTTITATASSPEARSLSYSWSASSGTIVGSGSSAILNTTGSLAGAITITCKVTDSEGLSASSATKVVVSAPSFAPPMINCAANPTLVTLGGIALITAVASSPEGRPLSYTWSASAGTISGAGNQATFDSTGSTAGSVTITCKVADSQGLTASATTSVKVSAPAPPLVSCSAAPSMIMQGGTATITAVATSPQALPLTYSYKSTVGSLNGDGATATLATGEASPGIVTVTCTVDQLGGGTASSTASVLVQSSTGEQALTNFQFVDSVGVNLHLAYADTVYVTQFPSVLKALTTLGVKHYRDGLDQYAQSFQYENAEALGKAGIKADWLMDFNNSALIINSVYANAPDTIGSFEGPNEDDANAGLPIQAFMQLLYDTVRSNPATASTPIIAPSFIQVASFATQGNLSSLVNFGNMHDYFADRNPETAAYGGSFYDCGGYGSMEFDACLAQMVGVGEPVVATETGYESGKGLPDAIIGRYQLRALFESLRIGVIRTFLYELVDDPSGNWGLMTNTFAPRPSYTAIENVLRLLADVNFARPGKLAYTLAGQTQNVHHLLLQKSDGSFYLALWLAVPSADPDNPSVVYDISEESVAVSLTEPVGNATSYALSDSGEITALPIQVVDGSFTVPVTDRVTLVSLAPGASH